MKIQQLMAFAAIALGAASLAPAAQAQSTGLIPVRVKVSLAEPASSSVAGHNNLGVEADVGLPKTGDGKTFVSVGYTSGSNNGNNMKVVPVTVGRYFSPPNPAAKATGNVYVGAGAGPYFVHINRDGDSSNKVAVGGYGVVGYQLPNKYFIEAKYAVTTKVRGADAGGLMLSIGRSF
jgi:hypothetical protein